MKYGITSVAIVLIAISTTDPIFAQQQLFEPYSQTIPGSEEAISMTPVPGGTFLMGTPTGEEGRSPDEGPQQKVKVDAFWMGTYEITWEQYDQFVEEQLGSIKNEMPEEPDVNVSADAISIPTPPYVDMSFGMGREQSPAVNMTQYAAVMFAKWLTAKTGVFYRLPTEAEWEYACRAGSNTSYYYGNESKELANYAWFEENSNEKYHEIGQKKPNAWGLYDMMGNVAEWTMDQYHPDYFERLEGDPAANPWFMPTELYPRSLRGGSWSHLASGLRCGARQGSEKEWKQRDPQLPKSRWWFPRKPFLGFRLVRPQETPSKKEMETYWLKAIDDY